MQVLNQTPKLSHALVEFRMIAARQLEPAAMAIWHRYPPSVCVGYATWDDGLTCGEKERIASSWPVIRLSPPHPPRSTRTVGTVLISSQVGSAVTTAAGSGQMESTGGQPGLVLDCRGAPTCHELGCCAASFDEASSAPAGSVLAVRLPVRLRLSCNVSGMVNRRWQNQPDDGVMA